MNQYHVYIMMNIKNTVNYTGITSDIYVRVWQHKTRKYEDSFTAKYYIDKLVYFEEYNDINEAITREKQIKGLSRNKKILIIKKLNPTLKDLSEGWYDNENKKMKK